MPIRQWICSLPWGLRALLGYDRKLCAEVVSAFMAEVDRSLRWRAKRELGLASGGYERWWELGSAGGMGQLVLGAPWGITVAGGAGAGTNDGRHYSVTVGVDLARLTVYRRTGDSWWKNTFPAYRPEEE